MRQKSLFFKFLVSFLTYGIIFAQEGSLYSTSYERGEEYFRDLNHLRPNLTSEESLFWGVDGGEIIIKALLQDPKDKHILIRRNKALLEALQKQYPENNGDFLIRRALESKKGTELTKLLAGSLHYFFKSIQEMSTDEQAWLLFTKVGRFFEKNKKNKLAFDDLLNNPEEALKRRLSRIYPFNRNLILNFLRENYLNEEDLFVANEEDLFIKSEREIDILILDIFGFFQNSLPFIFLSDYAPTLLMEWGRSPVLSFEEFAQHYTRGFLQLAIKPNMKGIFVHGAELKKAFVPHDLFHIIVNLKELDRMVNQGWGVLCLEAFIEQPNLRRKKGVIFTEGKKQILQMHNLFMDSLGRTLQEMKIFSRPKYDRFLRSFFACFHEYNANDHQLYFKENLLDLWKGIFECALAKAIDGFHLPEKGYLINSPVDGSWTNAQAEQAKEIILKELKTRHPHLKVSSLDLKYSFTKFGVGIGVQNRYDQRRVSLYLLWKNMEDVLKILGMPLPDLDSLSPAQQVETVRSIMHGTFFQDLEDYFKRTMEDLRLLFETSEGGKKAALWYQIEQEKLKQKWTGLLAGRGASFLTPEW